jgi:hypothetical protein
MEKKLKLSYDGGDSSHKKCRRGYDGVYGLVSPSFAFSGSLESGGQFYVSVVLGRKVPSVAVKMSLHKMYFTDKF